MLRPTNYYHLLQFSLRLLHSFIRPLHFELRISINNFNCFMCWTSAEYVWKCWTIWETVVVPLMRVRLHTRPQFMELKNDAFSQDTQNWNAPNAFEINDLEIFTEKRARINVKLHVQEIHFGSVDTIWINDNKTTQTKTWWIKLRVSEIQLETVCV